jgi:streptomycin 6-kinase
MAGQPLTMQLDPALARFQQSDPRVLAQTATSTLWTVTRPDGETAVLKLLHPDQTEYARGTAYLQALAGQGAVHVHAARPDIDAREP